MVTDIAYLGPAKRDVSIHQPYFRKSKDLPRSILPILAFDPGGVTGYSLLVLPRRINNNDLFSYSFETILRNKISWEHGELSMRDYENEGCYQFGKMLDDWPSAAIVVEDFILRPERQEKSRELLSPVRITAKLESHLWFTGRHMFLQSASQAKSTVTDGRLRLWGCYTKIGGLAHARDADRHVLLFLRRVMGGGGTALRSAAWPHVYMKERVEA